MPKKRKADPKEYDGWIGIEPPKDNPEARKRGKKASRKGKTGEREIVNLCKKYGIDARRLAPIQAAGSSTDAPDVEAGTLDIESKLQAQPNIRAAYKQACAGRRPGQYAVAATRKTRTEMKRDDKGRTTPPEPDEIWLATLGLEDLLDIYRDAMRWRERA